MVAESNTCDRNRLKLLLSDGLLPSQIDETQRHLETCETCRSELESLAADANIWSEMSRYLNRDQRDPDSPLSKRTPTRLLGTEDEQPILPAVETVLERLLPTDNPAMLGRLGEYDVMEVIGSGGMGVVLKAYDRQLNRFVAIKVLAPHFACSAAARKRFAREAKAAAAVVHPHVVSIHGVADAESLPYFVMQFVPGQSLQQRIDADAPLELKDILRIGMQAARGLAAAHAQGLVHRDIKPANILLENGVERVMLSDFGLARAADDASMTQSGVIAGTPQFMSPEQARGEAIDSRSDIFSLGSVMYAMCTGHSPFRSETTMGVLNRIYNEEPRPLRSLNNEIPDWFAAILDNMLAKDPQQRFQSADEVADILQQWLSHLQQPDIAPQPVRPNHVIKPSGKPPSIIRRTTLAIGGVLFALLSVIILLELNKGTLKIECQDASVPVRIMKGDKVYEQLTVTPGKDSVRIAAGDYVVVVDTPDSGLIVENSTVTVRRGKVAIVSITQQTATQVADEAAQLDDVNPFPAQSQDEPDLIPKRAKLILSGVSAQSSSEPVYQGKTLSAWLQELKVTTEPNEHAFNAVDALRVDASPELLRRLIDDWAEYIGRERDPQLNGIAINVVCVLAGKQHTDQALEVTLAVMRRQPSKGPLSIFASNYTVSHNLLQYAASGVQRLDEEAVHTRMAAEIEKGNSQSRYFALAFAGLKAPGRFAVGPVPIASLLAASHDQVPTVRRKAIAKLAVIYGDSEQTKSRLHLALQDDETMIAYDAGVHLAKLDPTHEPLIPQLLTWARDEDCWAQCMAAISLTTAAENNRAALAGVIELLEDPEWGNLWFSIGATPVSRWDWDDLPVLTPIPVHGNVSHCGRLSAIDGLGKLGARAEQAVKVIRMYLWHSNQELREAARRAFKQITGEEPPTEPPVA